MGLVQDDEQIGTMNKFLFVFVIAFGLIALSQTATPVTAARSKGLSKLLDEILKRLDSFSHDEKVKLKQLSSSHKKDVAASNAELSRLREAYSKQEKENTLLKDEDQKARDTGAAALLRLEQQVEKEKRLIGKIKAMLQHEVGTDSSHAAKSCDEVFLDLTMPSGSYWLVRDGRPQKTRCVRAEDSTKVWSGGCSSSDRGKKGWANMCLDVEEFNSAPEYFKRKGDHLQVLKAGLYNIKSAVQNYCSGRCGRHSRILISGGSIDYNHRSGGYKTITMNNDVTWPLKKNARIYVSIHGAGGDIWRWKSMKTNDPRNRLQVSYAGPTDETPFFSAGCKGSKRNSGWQRVCLTATEHNRQITKTHLDTYTDGRIIVKKPGYYRITSHVMSHSNGGHHYLRVLVNGGNKQYTLSYNSGWHSKQVDITYPLNEDDTIEVYSHANGGNPYTWHSHSTTGHTTRVQVTYVSALKGKEAVKFIQGGPKSHYRSTSWYRYRFDRLRFNTLPSNVVSYRTNGVVTVKKNSWIRVNAIGQLHTNGRQPRRGTIKVNGKIVFTTIAEKQKQWQNLQMDYTFPAMKGDKINIWWRAQGGNPYVHLFNPSSGEGMAEVYAL